MKEWTYSRNEMGILSNKVSDALGGYKKSSYYVNVTRDNRFEIVRKSDRKTVQIAMSELMQASEERRPFEIVANVVEVIKSKFEGL